MYYASGQPTHQGPPSLRTALTTIHRDPGWWHKMLVGGLVWMTGVGMIVAEGYQIESLDNTRSGYPTPLPLWRDWGTKAIQGLFALVIDFFFFLFPVLFGGLLWACSAIMVALIDASAALRPVGLIVMGAVVLWLVVMWLLGVSPIAKQFYVNDGLPKDALSSKVMRTALAAPGRGLYLRARLHSIPPYLLAVAVLFMAWYAQRWGSIPALVILWLGLAVLLYARLVAIQLYQSASQQVERRRWEARRAARA